MDTSTATAAFLSQNGGDCQGPEWISRYFGECITSTHQMVAFYVGLLSILCWLIAQGPQLITNYKNGNAESLSALFLVQWLVGDSLNLIGSVLSNQQATQIITAYYFVFMDLLMVTQYAFYKVKVSVTRSKSRKHGSMPVYSVLAGAAFTGTVGARFLLSTAPGSNVDPNFSTGRTLQSVDLGFHTDAEYTGYFLGILSACFYLSSRIPQILKNHRRRSTGGLAFQMFMLAVCGNLTYALSIFINMNSWQFLLQKLPWLVGSLGTLFFDFIIAAQFFAFGENKQPMVVLGADESTPILKDERVIYVHGPPAEEDTRYPISPLIYPAAQKPNYVIP